MSYICGCADPTPSVSHVIVLPQDPSAAPSPGMTPSAVPDSAQDDAMVDLFGGGMATGGSMGKWMYIVSQCNDNVCDNLMCNK